MASSSAAVILAPILRANEIVCIGPFKNPSDPRRSTFNSSTYRLYKKVVWSLIAYVLLRKFVLLACKMKFARHLIGTDIELARVPMIIVMIIYSANKLNRFHGAFEMYDKFPHDELLNLRLRRSVRIIAGILWTYSFGRVLMDWTAFFEGNNLPKYITNELLLNPNNLPTSLYVLAGVYALFNIALQRLLTSLPLTIIIFTYICINFLTEVKFRKLEESFAECLKREPFSLSEFTRLRLMHADLCQLVLYLDEFLSPLALYFHAGVVIGTCLYTTDLIRKYKSGALANAPLVDLASFVVNLSYMMLTLPSVTVTAAMVCEAPERLTKLLNELLEDREVHNMRSDSQQIRLLLSQLDVKNARMTAWRFYSLDRGAIVKTFGTVLTYVSLIFESA